MSLNKNTLCLFTLLCILSHQSGNAQISLEQYGHNKIQTKNNTWTYYQYDKLKIYHYNKAGKDLARYIAEQAEKDIKAIENRIGGVFPQNLDIFIYNNYDDFLQSNLGVNSLSPIQNFDAGKFQLIGNKFKIYFNGDHANLKEQLRNNLAQVVLEHMLEGDSFKDKIRNNTVLQLPNWILKGYLDYVVNGWTTNDENSWKLLVNNPKNKKLEVIADLYPTLSGKAFWKYINNKFTAQNVKNILYFTQVKGNFNEAIFTAINQKTVPTYDSVITYFQNRYASESYQFGSYSTDKPLITIPIPKAPVKISNIMLSPRGNDVAYIRWENGEYKIVLERTRIKDGVPKKETSVLMNGGNLDYTATEDPNYPAIAWSASGYKLGIVYRKYNTLSFKLYDALKGKIQTIAIPPSKFDRILSFGFSQDDDVLVMSAIKNGQSDIFEFRIKRKIITQITDDPWDDLQPSYIFGGSRKGIAFLSNRPEPIINVAPLPNELPNNKLNAYFYNATTKSFNLVPLTKGNLYNIEQLIAYGPDNFAYLTDENGIKNKNVVLFNRDEFNIDTAYSVPVTNYNYNILYQQYIASGSSIAEVIQTDTSYNVFYKPAMLPEPEGELKVVNKPLVLEVDAIKSIEDFKKSKNDTLNLEERKSSDFEEFTNNNEQVTFDLKEGNLYQTNYRSRKELALNPSNIDPVLERNINTGADANNFANKLSIGDKSEANFSHIGNVSSQTGKRIVYVDSTYLKLKNYNYREGFIKSDFSGKLDKSILFNRYQAYTGQPDNPNLGALIGANLIDKFENYKISGGIRLPFGSSGTAYYVGFENLKRRLDWGVFGFQQRSKSQFYVNYSGPSGGNIVPVTAKNITSIVQGQASYPLSETKRVWANFGLRQDQLVTLASEQYSLNTPTENRYYGFGRLEFVYDNSKNPMPNITIGDKYKLAADYLYKFKDDMVFNNGDVMRPSSGGFYNFSFDIRHYRPIYRNIIYALRVAGAHSGGGENIIYYLGGVDNSFSPDNANYPQASEQTYAFQTLATNMRGYNQNARNGNTYAVMNAEVRVPIANTLIRKPVQSSLLNSLQLIGFLDIGNAWAGLLPKEDEVNRSKTYISPLSVSNSPGNVIVNIPNSIEKGLAIGYGVGLRALVYGYYLRTDFAMNKSSQFKVHVSLGMDF